MIMGPKTALSMLAGALLGALPLHAVPPPFQTLMASEFDCVLVAAVHVGESSR
jgi:hypothetical protein